MNIQERAIDASKYVTAKSDIKLGILAKYGILANAAFGDSDIDIIKVNKPTFEALMSLNVVKWVLTERNGPEFKAAVQTNPKIAQMFITEGHAKMAIQKVSEKTGIAIREYCDFDSLLDGLSFFGTEQSVEEEKTEEESGIEFDEEDFFKDEEDDIDRQIKQLLNGEESSKDEIEQPVENTATVENAVADNNDYKSNISRYNENIHEGYRKQIEDLIMSVWEDMYAYYANGQEIIDGFIIPGGTIANSGETEKYQGLLTLNPKITVKPNTMSNVIFEEFVEACKDNGVHITKTVSVTEDDVKAFKYNPLLQRKIASGEINKAAFNRGWNEYKKALLPYIYEKTKELAIDRVDTGSDEVIYNALSGYMISLMCVNYKDNLGTQLRLCCGDTSKTIQVANRLVERLRERETTHRSLAQGKLLLSDAIISDSKLSATINLYTNMAGYQAIPQFMGELLCRLNTGMFRPSLQNMIIGVDLKNNIVTAPFTKWLLPIIAGSRSGKGVLTLSMLLNVIGGGTPLFYLDGKPDMAVMLWKLQQKYGIQKSIIIDGKKYEGVSDIDEKPYRAPYINNIYKMMQMPSSNEILENHIGTFIYLKTMLVILLSTRYYRDKMDSCYGDLFVVFDEVYAVIKSSLGTLIQRIDAEIAKNTGKENKDKRAEAINIRNWIDSTLQDYISMDVGVFGAGIKALALTQYAQDTQYNIEKFPTGKTFCTNFLLKRAVKLFGRQEGGSGKYGIEAKKNTDTVVFDLFDKYFHFGIGSESGNTYKNIKVFKPLLVLNENDCKELTGAPEDGAFVKGVIERVSKYADVEQFREKYFMHRPLADSIGFEGALEQVGRLMEVNWMEMLKLSLGRAYEIAEKALRYYGIIGTKGISDVYDFICSTSVEHLWTYNDIIRNKAKGTSLGEREILKPDEQGNSFFNNTVTDSEDNDDLIDFGDNVETPKQSDNLFNRPLTNSYGVNNGPMGSYGGQRQRLSAEEAEIILNRGKSKPVYDAKPVDIYEENRQSMFEANPDANDTVVIDIDDTDRQYVAQNTDENTISAELNDPVFIRNNRHKMFSSFKGADYEYTRRWKAILNSICKRMNPNLVSRVIILADEMYVNGRMVNTKNITGGFENIRFEDLINFKMLFKTFRNLKDLLIDTTILERYQIENPGLPVNFFEQSSSLIRVSILLPDGSREVINRNSASQNSRFNEITADTKRRSMFNVVCAAKNSKYKDMGTGYKNKVWRATKSFGGKGWSAVQNQLQKKNPSFVKASAIGLFTGGVLIVGAGLSLLSFLGGGIFRMVKGYS